MAKEKIEIATNPEKIEVKSHHNRRNSTGNFSISTEGVKILPRYLRASFGSCHDFCKYGIEDSLVKNARIPIPKRTTERSGEGQDRVKDVILEERKKKLPIKPKALPNYKSSANDKQGQVTKKEAQISAKKVAVSSKRFSLPGNPMDVSADDLVPDLRTKPFSFSKMANASSRHYGHVSTSKGVGVLQENTVGGSRTGGNSYINTSKEMKISNFRKIEDNERPAVSPSSRASIKRELSKKSGNDKYPKNASLVKSQNGGKQAECKIHIDEYIPEKTLYVIETKLGNRTENVPDTSHFIQSTCPTSEDQNLEFGRDGILISRSPPSVENKQLRESRNGGHVTRPSLPSCLSTYNKGLRRSQNENRNTRPFSPSSESMKSDESDPFSGSTMKPTRVGIVCMDNEVGSPQKINFRRGKVVDVLSKKTSPQKLSFEQRRVLCEKQNEKGDSEPRCLKELVGVDKLTGSKTEPVKVVLRHWDVDGKKGGQNLFNNVIEDTASKLVQTRKSKVRALVHAFETMILLQDTKILANN